VEDEDERVRWWLWLLLAVVLCVIVAGIVVIVRVAVRRQNQGDGSSVVRRVDLNQVSVQSFPTCDDLMERLWEASKYSSLALGGSNAEPKRHISTWLRSEQPWLDDEETLSSLSLDDYETLQVCSSDVAPFILAVCSRSSPHARVARCCTGRACLSNLHPPPPPGRCALV
jgi:hypothetical protein